jgi:Sigma-70 factor, region 1.1
MVLPWGTPGQLWQWPDKRETYGAVIEEKNDQVRQLIATGKERGYLLNDEVNDILPAEVHSRKK